MAHCVQFVLQPTSPLSDESINNNAINQTNLKKNFVIDIEYDYHKNLIEDSQFQLRYLQTLNSISAEHNSTIIFPVPIGMM